MATGAAHRLGEMAQNTGTIVGIEAMAAAQGIEFHRPLASSALLEEALRDIRRRVAFYDHDRFLAPDIEAMKQWVLSAPAQPEVKAILPSAGASLVQLGDTSAHHAADSAATPLRRVGERRKSERRRFHRRRG